MREPPERIPPIYSLPPGVEEGRLIPPQNMGVVVGSQQRDLRRETSSSVVDGVSRHQPSSTPPHERPRSNLSLLLDSEEKSRQQHRQGNKERGENVMASTPRDVFEKSGPGQPLLSRQSLVDDDSGHRQEDAERRGLSLTIIRSAPTRGDDPRREALLSAVSFEENLRVGESSLEAGSSRAASAAVGDENLSSVFHTKRRTSAADASGSKVTSRMGRRCMSSKELGTLAPPSGSPFANILQQREVIEATLQQRLMDARRTDDRTPSPGVSVDSSNDSSSRARRAASNSSRGRNESRNRRRAAHHRAVIDELCEIVTDLFAAESKLLNPSSYGVGDSFHRDQILSSVKNFVSSLPPRYALGVETPSEVLVHMRLMAAARTDDTKAVVHISNHHRGEERWELSSAIATRSSRTRSRCLVTISCADAHGLLEFITKLLATGGSRVVDADVMLSSENIVLDRFVVEMNGRLRLDKFVNSIEAFLISQRARDSTDSGEASSPSNNNAVSTAVGVGSDLSRQTPGALYFHPPRVDVTPAPQETIEKEMETAVPLSQVLASASSVNLASDSPPVVVPMRRIKSGSVQHNRNTVASPGPSPSILQPILASSPQQGSPNEGEPDMQQQSRQDGKNRRRRPLVNREAVALFEEESADRPTTLDYVTVPSQPFDVSQGQEHQVPLIPFEELMLIETLGMGRVSTIYRAAWQRNNQLHHQQNATLTNVSMVALKVATVSPETGDMSHVDELRREADIAAILHHPNICDLVGIAADNECFCLAYTFCEGGSLLSLLADNGRYYEYLPIALDIAHGMAYLHSRNVIHRDLKPSNILLSRDHRAKIADFGMSVANTGQELTAETGTYRYMAPEVIRHESYSSNADVYSFGIVLWQLITREIPFATMTPIQAAFSVAEGRRPEIPDSCPPRLREIIESCWDQDSHKRPSFTYIAMTLADYARMAFSPANVGAQTLQIANEMLATVQGNSTVNVDFSTPVETTAQSWLGGPGGGGLGAEDVLNSEYHESGNIGLEI